MFKTLLRIRMTAMFSGMFKSSKNQKQRGTAFKILIGILAIYVILCFGFVFGMLFESLCVPLCDAGLSWLYFSVAGMVAFFLSLIGSVFATQTQLYDAKDNELLLSMPIPPRTILLSRIGILLLSDYLFELLVMLPAGIVFLVHRTVTIGMIFGFFIGVLFLPLFVLAISAFFGWILAIISNKIRFKNVVTVILSVGFLAVYFVVYSQIQNYINILIANGSEVANAVKKAAFPFYHFGLAMADGNIISMLLYTVCMILPFAVVYMILSHNFIRIATSRKSTVKAVYKEKNLKVQTVRHALVGKELRRFFSSAMYMLNAALGVVFMIILSVFLAVKQDMLTEYLAIMPSLSGMLTPMVSVVLAFCCTMNIVSAPSISLEGKSLWIAQSIPVDGGDILLSKAYAHMIICLPAVAVSAVICGIALPANVFQIVLLFLLPAVVTVFTAMFGVWINLLFPKFDWINETAAVKQGASTIIAMLGSMAILAVPAILYIALVGRFVSLEIYLLICIILFAAASVLLGYYLKTRGGKKFAAL